jgi:proline dehydrogenase
MSVVRSALLWASQNPRMERAVRSSRAMRPLVKRFMPGESIDDALSASRTLQASRGGDGGAPVIITYLGENVATEAAADDTLAEYQRLITALQPMRDAAHVSIKLTQFGWDLNRDRALDRVRILSRLVAANGSVLAIDMESSPYVQSTVEAYEELARGARHVALCLQAYLHRTPGDVERLLAVQPYIRLVKGAYREPASAALQSRADIDARYRDIARTLLRASSQGTRAAFGTHDVPLVHRVRDDAREMGVTDGTYEIQMLYGIQDAGRRQLAAAGHKTRVLISYGKAWYAWFMRRLAEKPSNLMLVSRNLFSRGVVQ